MRFITALLLALVYFHPAQAEEVSLFGPEFWQSPAVELFSVEPLSGGSGDTFRFSIKTFQADGYRIRVSCPRGIVSLDGSGTDLCANPRAYPASVTSGTLSILNLSGVRQSAVIYAEIIDEDGFVADGLYQEVLIASPVSVPRNRNSQNSTPVTLPAYEISDDSASIGGSFPVADGYVARYFEWGESPLFGNQTARSTGLASEDFFAKLQNLDPRTTYYYRAVADATLEGAGERFYGETRRFSTLARESGTPSDQSKEPAAAPSECVRFSKQFGFGEKDTVVSGDVNILQEFLGSRGYFSLEPTGFFGPATRASVRQFQLENGIAQTGYIGPLTQSRIQKLSCEA